MPETATTRRASSREKLGEITGRIGFGVEVARERWQRRGEWGREERENKARRVILQNVLLDRKGAPLPPDIIERKTRRSRSRIDAMVGDASDTMIGDPEGHALVFMKVDEREYMAAHVQGGAIQTLAAIDVADPARALTRVVFNNTHEGRIESARAQRFSLTRTAVHTLNYLTKRGAGWGRLPQGNPVPAVLRQRIMEELVNPDQLMLGEALFRKLNEEAGRPLADGGVLIIADTALGDRLASPTDQWKPLRFFSRYSEIDDFMTLLLCRGDAELSKRVKAFGHTSRGTAFTEATFVAAMVGNTEPKPVFPGYHPYLQSYEETDPVRPSPTAYAIVELGKAHARGKPVVLVDEAPTTDRVYATAIHLAHEQGVDIASIPVVFMVAVHETNQGAELIDGPLNFNYSLGDDCRRGFQLALEHFQDVTVFTPQVGVTGIPLADFDDFARFMNETGNPFYQKIGEIFRLRAKDFATSGGHFEEEAKRRLGKPLGIEPRTFAAQDTLIAAYLVHPEWFVVKDMPLTYRTLHGKMKRKEKITVVTGVTPEGKECFRSWLWASIRENFVAH